MFCGYNVIVNVFEFECLVGVCFVWNLSCKWVFLEVLEEMLFL